jgi:hypothetical protein
MQQALQPMLIREGEKSIPLNGLLEKKTDSLRLIARNILGTTESK